MATTSDSIYDLLPTAVRSANEVVLWEGRCGLSACAIVGAQVMEIDSAGLTRGFAVITSSQLITGNTDKRGRSPEVWDSFEGSDLVATEHANGVAFEVKSFGPVDLVVVAVESGRDAIVQAAALLTESDGGHFEPIAPEVRPTGPAWSECTGATVDEAKELAAQRLGAPVSRIEIISAPKWWRFWNRSSGARVRAYR